MRTVVVRLVLLVVGFLAMPVTAFFLDGIDDSGTFILPTAAVAAAALGALIGRAGLDPDRMPRQRSVAGVLWALLGVVLSVGTYFLLLSSIGS